MGERKVLNKYYPPDFDPSLLPKNKRPLNMTYVVRVMIPMSVRCTSCGEYMYRGKKFNATKETVLDESYLGIKIFRFYIHCVKCSSSITFKTDPKNGDYVCEFGASRNFEPWRDNRPEGEQQGEEAADEAEDAMRRLEERTLESKREMDILDSLDASKALNSQYSKTNLTKVIDKIHTKNMEDLAASIELTDEDEMLLESVQFGEMKRIEDNDDMDDQEARRKRLAAAGILSSAPTAALCQVKNAAGASSSSAGAASSSNANNAKKKTMVPQFVVKKKEETASDKAAGALGSLFGYDSSSSNSGDEGK